MALVVLLTLLFAACARGQPASPDTQVRQAVQAFYTAFSSPDGFERAEVLKEVLEVHRTFLKGVTDTVIQMDVRMASPDVAVATVTSDMSVFTGPDG